jgi:hypothetical protein
MRTPARFALVFTLIAALGVFAAGSARADSENNLSQPDNKLNAERPLKNAIEAAALGGIVPFASLYYAEEYLAPQTFALYPYRQGKGYINSDEHSVSWAMHGATTFIDGGGKSYSALVQVRSEARIGGDLSWTSFENRALDTVHESGLFSFHATGSLLEYEDWLLESGWGLAMLQNGSPKLGPSVVLNAEFFRQAPWTMRARYEPSMMSDGRFYHMIDVGGGFIKGPFSLNAGIRAFLNPRRNAYGPQAGLSVWF